ncbi:hypothetical protein Dda_2886 [Drechslerella dactyloides]|uniref:Hemerythrin-like domain-containing protein n=1 Tax=Drechslerella dactyloides TaxID=74499 RepID=A0AAD6J1A9_DREDA|nr:hypothetical protein Dda_2886 [Drechslerella dactyloides]
MATQTEHTYTDRNAEKFPDPVEPLDIDKYNISPATVNMKDPVGESMSQSLMAQSIACKFSHVSLQLVASTMGLFMIHGLLRRSLRCVARHARTVEPARRAAFVAYAKMSLDILHSHHGHEEDLWFPIMKPYVDFEESSHEHEEIERLMLSGYDLLKTAQAHVDARKSATAPAWPGEEISTTVGRLVELLIPHLQKEETLACLYGRRAPASVYHEFEKQIEKAVNAEMKEAGMVWSGSFQLRHWSKNEKAVWPPMPALVRGGFEFLGWLFYGKTLAFGPTAEELKN